MISRAREGKATRMMAPTAEALLRRVGAIAKSLRSGARITHLRASGGIWQRHVLDASAEGFATRPRAAAEPMGRSPAVLLLGVVEA